MTKAELQSKSNEELLEIQRDFVRIGAPDDEKYVNACKLATTDEERREVIECILEITVDNL